MREVPDSRLGAHDKVVNCAQCRKVLLLHWNPDWAYVGGRIKGRPYCSQCLEPRSPKVLPGPRDDDGASPAQENAIRALEDAP